MRVYKAESITCGQHKSGYLVVCENLKEWGIAIREDEEWKNALAKYNITDDDVVAFAQESEIDWKNNKLSIPSMESEVTIKEQVKEK